MQPLAQPSNRRLILGAVREFLGYTLRLQDQARVLK